ncbi:hypothetical protein [Paraburkholderia caribensis]|jgi:hypothetical protein|uniref:hypothetical protein n=1 Tax=Paraburkholderia caribensis TaxID=75105 RepID=UPI0007217A29|nr:hypothetical protein [Paraburkholderia caribensis]ALP65209.1 hypothetical protein AN416_21685 [Paraburkholderia caribensis]AUT53636.1 hypothetical protein C2L66_16805 [Paraburkholderia caribensis]
MSTKRIEVGGIVVIEPDANHFRRRYPRFDTVERVEKPYQQLQMARDQALDHEYYNQHEQSRSMEAGEYPLPVIDLSGGNEVMLEGWSTYDVLVQRGVAKVPALLVEDSAQQP